MISSSSSALQFVSFNSQIDTSFWYKLAQNKLDIDKLEEKIHDIWGKFSNSDPPGLNALLELDCTAFNKNFTEKSYIPMKGYIINKNTVEDFKLCDKSDLITEFGEQIWENIQNMKVLENPSILFQFWILSYADLKKYQFLYWFAFPALNFDQIQLHEPPSLLNKIYNSNQLTTLVDSYLQMELNQKHCFLIKMHEDQAEILPLKQIDLWKLPEDFILGFSDSCGMESNPGWSLRLIIAFLSFKCPHLINSNIKVFSIRLKLFDMKWHCKDSLYLNLNLPSIDFSKRSWIGWQKNDRGKFGPRLANLANSMDPIKLAESAVDLNLRLMKWRLMPDINLEIINSTKCLLFGAGTLGCAVARTLMGWGVRNITFIDNGRVSYSNPVRQSLYTFEDCKQNGRLKAEVASCHLKEIFPGINSQGFELTIPMPGHPIGESQMEETKKSAEQIEKLIKEHDAIFLLLDSRESRWLPTMIATRHSKIVINAALGFDTYLVMRHGLGPVEEVTSQEKSSLVPGQMLGCYFCNDVTAPGNSQKDRTLDQQCTVTRPGVSAIAAGLATELLISILQHSLKGHAPASITTTNECDETLGTLGLVPHSIRGFLTTFEQLKPATQRFKQCIACSSKVTDTYEKEGFEFLLKAFNEPRYLEDITGLTALHLQTDDFQLWELNDEDEEFEEMT